MKLEEACVFARVGVSCMTWLGAFVREVDELANVFRYSLQYIRYPLFLVRNVLFFFLTRTTSPGYVLILKPRLTLIILKSGLAWTWLTQDWINLNKGRRKYFFEFYPSLVAILGWLWKIFLVDFSPSSAFNPEIWFLFEGQEGFSPNEVQAIGINSRSVLEKKTGKIWQPCSWMIFFLLEKHTVLYIFQDCHLSIFASLILYLT